MRVELSAHAIARLRQIHEYVAADSPRNADALLERLLWRAESLASLPLRYIEQGKRSALCAADTQIHAIRRQFEVLTRSKREALDSVNEYNGWGVFGHG